MNQTTIDFTRVRACTEKCRWCYPRRMEDQLFITIYHIRLLLDKLKPHHMGVEELGRALCRMEWLAEGEYRRMIEYAELPKNYRPWPYVAMDDYDFSCIKPTAINSAPEHYDWKMKQRHNAANNNTNKSDSKQTETCTA